MASISFRVNGKPQTLDADPDMPLLRTLRDNLAMTGTKFGCGIDGLARATGLKPKPGKRHLN
ncbi:MAG TPA: hypothetical protein VKS44_04220 [Candidatus Acidoferrales bacterium]|nr:hypothetical protein [Candidatus Acidoferrales bacterium]